MNDSHDPYGTATDPHRDAPDPADPAAAGTPATGSAAASSTVTGSAAAGSRARGATTTGPATTGPATAGPVSTGSPGIQPAGSGRAARSRRVLPAVSRAEWQRADPWLKLRRILRLRGTGSQLLVGLLCALLGFFLVTQIRETQRSSLEALPQEDLVRILEESGREADALEQDARSLDRTIQELQAGISGDQAVQEASRERLRSLGILAGTEPAVGRGLRIVVQDQSGDLNAATMLSILQELRNAGAEVVQIGPVRVTASTYFTDSPDGVTVNGTVLGPRIVLEVIGDPAIIEPALSIPGGAADSVTRRGGTMTVTRQDEVVIDAVVDVPQFRHAEETAGG